MDLYYGHLEHIFQDLQLAHGLSGVIYGLFLYETPNKEKRFFFLKAFLSNIIVLTAINLLLNSLWLKIMYGNAFTYYLGIRIATQLIMLPIQIATIILLERTLKKPIKKYLYKEEQLEQ